MADNNGCIDCGHRGMKIGPTLANGRRTIELATDAWSEVPLPPMPRFEPENDPQTSAPAYLDDSVAGGPLPSTSLDQLGIAGGRGGETSGWTDIILSADDAAGLSSDGIVFGDDGFFVRKGRRKTTPDIPVPGFEPSPGVTATRENPVEKFLYPYQPVVIKPDKVMRQMRRMLGLDKDDEPDPHSPFGGRDEGWIPTDPARAPLFPLRPSTGVLGPWPCGRVNIGLWGGTTLRGTLGGVGGIFVELPWNRVRLWIGVSGEPEGRRIKPGIEIGGSILWD